jgi:hypothetical protein
MELTVSLIYPSCQVEVMQNAGGEQGEEARKMMEDQVKSRLYMYIPFYLKSLRIMYGA